MDHYRTLHIRRDADPEVVEKAYKALCMKHHPDRYPPAERADATERMRRLNEAYEVLRDPRKRAAYDDTLPPEGEQGAWDIFWEEGLFGLYRRGRAR